MEEFYAGVQEKWEGFLEWCDEKGIPLRGVCDALEERGIPALPLFVAIILAIVFAALWFSVVGPMLIPTSTTLRLRVVDEAGSPLSGAVVALRLAGVGPIGQNTTDENGYVYFSNVPAGEVTAEANAGPDYEPTTDSYTLAAGTPKSSSLKLTKKLLLRVTLRIQIDGPLAANVSLWTENKGRQIETRFGSIVSFDVDANTNYVVTADAPGYRPEERTIPVGLVNTAPQVIRMWKIGETPQAKLHVFVRESTGLEGASIENATVEVRVNGTDGTLATLSTDADGATEAVDVPVGASFSVLAKADGFLSKSSAVQTAEAGDNYVTIRLVKKTADNSKAIAVSVVDEDGNFVESPTIMLYCGLPLSKREESTPAEGVTSFDAPAGEDCLVTAFKQGLLPSSLFVGGGGEFTLTLETPTSSNSAELEVRVSDKNGVPAPAAQVAVFYSNGYPTGVPEQRTGLDGKTSFTNFAVGGYEARATSGNQVGSTQFTLTPGQTNIVAVQLAPAKASIEFEVIDYYSNAPVAGALVSLSDAAGNAVNCTAGNNGKCSVQAEEGTATYSVAASGYGTHSATVQVTGGASLNESVRIVSSAVAASIRLTFLGVFDSKGKKVSTLDPATVYSAKYLIRAPPASFDSAEAFVLLGNPQGGLDQEPAEIIDYYAPDAFVEGGADFSAAAYEEQGTTPATPTPISLEVLNTTEQINASATGGVPQLPSTVGTSHSLNQEGYKWARFRFGSFNGSKEIKVVFRTKAVSLATVSLSHRTAFTTATGVLRDPQDAAAGVSKPELLATTTLSGNFEVSFQGECSGSLCVQAYLEGVTGKTGSGTFEAVVPEEFNLKFKVVSQAKAQATLSTESTALQLIEAISGGSRVPAKPAAEGTQEISLPSVTGDGSFRIKARAYAQDALLSLAVSSGEDSVEKTFSVSVSNSRNSLKVEVRPTLLKALEQNKVTFTVTDAYGQPVSSARVSLGVEDDALGTTFESSGASEEGSAQHAEGVYVIDGIEPQRIGEVDYQVSAEGFRTKKGTLNVVTQKLFSIEPSSVSVTTGTEKGEQEPAEISLTNLLENDVRVSAAVIPDENPLYTNLLLSEPAFTLRAKEEKQLRFSAVVSQAILTVAMKAGTLSEKVSGRVHVLGQLAQTTQEADVRFTASTSVQQQALADLVEVSTEEIDFSINPPREAKKTEKLNVTNLSPFPVIVNQQSSQRNVRITPLSAQIAPGQSREFTVTATLPRESLNDRCIVEDTTQEVDLEFRIAMQSISVKKLVKANVEILASSRCYLDDGLVFTLPVPVVFKFPVGTVIRGQPADDGSIPVLLPSKDKLVFYQGSSMYGGYAAERAQNSLSYDPYGNTPYYSSTATSAYYRDPSLYSSGTSFEQTASVNQQQAVVPAGVPFVMSSRYAQSVGPVSPLSLSSNSVIVRFPTVVFIQLPADAQQQPDAMGLRVNLRNAYVILPPNTPIAQAPGYGVIAQIPPNTPVAFGRTGTDLGEMDFQYDEETILELPSDAQAYQVAGGVMANLSECTRLTIRAKSGKFTHTTPAARAVFVEGASLEGTGRSGRIRVPPGSKIKVYTCLDITDDDQKLLSITQRQPVTIILPPGYEGPPRRYKVDFDSCMPLDVRGSVAVSVSSVRRIVFPESAIGREVKQADGSTLWETTIPEGEEWSILPCDASGPVSVHGTGDYLSGSPANLTFSLSDEHQSDKKEVCLYNSGSQLLYPYSGEHYVESISSPIDQQAFSQIISRDRIYFSGQLVGTPANLALDFQNRQCNRLVIEASLSAASSDWIDANGCVAKDGWINGSITFHAKNQKDWQGTWALPVKIKISRSRNGCVYNRVFDVNNSLHGVFVNYADDWNNERTQGPMKLSFKSPGQYRFLTLANNLLEPAEISASGDAPVECELPASMSAGDAQLVRCTSVRQGDGNLKITFTGTRTGNSTEKSVLVVVFPEPATPEARELYSASPVGELAPPQAVTQAASSEQMAAKQKVSLQDEGADEPPAPLQERVVVQSAVEEMPEADTSFITCQKFFCDAEQTRSAYVSFLSNMKSYLDSITKSQETNTFFCEHTVLGSQGLLTKSIILQKVAANQSLDEFNKMLRQEAGGAQVSNSYRDYFEGITGGSVRGCGWYKVTATIDACKAAGSHADASWRNEVGIRVRVQKIQDCEQNLANAALFLRGNSPDELGVNVGHRLSDWPSEFSRVLDLPERIMSNARSVDFSSPSTLLNMFDIGVMAVGPYATEPNERDAKAATSLYQYLYGGQEHYAAPAAYYDDGEFCWDHGKYILGTMYGIGTGLLASCLIPGGQGVCIRVAQGMAQAVAICAGMGIAETATSPPGGAVCGMVNDCISSGIYGIVSALLPTGGQVALGRGLAARVGSNIVTRTAEDITRRQALRSGLVLAGIAGGTSAAVNLLASDASETSSATVPLAASAVYASRIKATPAEAVAQTTAPTAVAGAEADLAAFFAANGIVADGALAGEIGNRVRGGAAADVALREAQDALVQAEATRLAGLPQNTLNGIAQEHGLQAVSLTDDAAITGLARARVLGAQRTEDFLRQLVGDAAVERTAAGELRILFRRGADELIDAGTFSRVTVTQGLPANIIDDVALASEMGNVNGIGTAGGRGYTMLYTQSPLTAAPAPIRAEIAQRVFASNGQLTPGMAFEQLLAEAESQGSLAQFVEGNFQRTFLARTSGLPTTTTITEDVARQVVQRWRTPGFVNSPAGLLDQQLLTTARAVETTNLIERSVIRTPAAEAATRVAGEEAAAAAAADAGAAASGGRISRARDALRRAQAGRIALQVASTLLFTTDMRPVQAELDPLVPSHIVSYHLSGSPGDSYFSTVDRLCVKTAQGCIAEESFYLGNACNSNYAACLLQTPVTSFAAASPQGYDLLMAINNPRVNAEQFFKSVFAPDDAPLTNVAVKGGTLGAAEISRLQSQREDTGTGRGAGESAS
ncbi:carboxypeptidase regulatory-like domain-containing protein [Candidatus Micrarchaeota archaeon]|nr:carboxypeptidase regulatory-like domain-containing protein [Candidatus Micrarchaeota archaeon]